MREMEAEIRDRLGPFDRETSQLRFAATLRGDPPAEVSEMVAARETHRAAIVARLRQELSYGR